jgi:hypothetical protein
MWNCFETEIEAINFLIEAIRKEVDAAEVKVIQAQSRMANAIELRRECKKKSKVGDDSVLLNCCIYLGPVSPDEMEESALDTILLLGFRICQDWRGGRCFDVHRVNTELSIKQIEDIWAEGNFHKLIHGRNENGVAISMDELRKLPAGSNVFIEL